MTAETWMITGANRGLGRALCEAALEAGHNVLATVRGDHSLPDHGRMMVKQLDVRDRARSFAVVAEAKAAFNRLDVLVNCAGYGLIGAIEEIDEDEARDILDADLLGPLWLSQAVLPIMRAQGTGHIVQVSTVGAVGTMPTLGLYNAAKWGLEGFSEALANEVKRFGIRVSLAQPGAIDTDWAGSSMRFSSPHPAYDELRIELFGASEVPWRHTQPSGGTSPELVAGAILEHVANPEDSRLRLLIGDEAPSQVQAALALRHADYSLDSRWR